MLLANKKVAIIGGGPGGLTLARLLVLKGVDVRVYERDVNQNARVQGAPLDLHDESGLAAIKKAGLLGEFKNNYMAGADRMQIMNGKAEVFYSDHDHKALANFESEHFRPEIDRGVLRRILLNALAESIVIWDSHFISMKREGEGWLVEFRNGKIEYADLVIAADGAHSKIRSYLTDIKAFYSGITMLEGTIYDAKNKAPNIFKLLKGGKIMAFGDNQNILMGQKGNGEIGFYASIRVDENWSSENDLDYKDNAQLLSWFQATYPEWASIWYELFTSAEYFVPRPINCMPLDQNWETQSNLTLIGDAAHVMPPFAGEGVNMAMLDALELSEVLTSNDFSSIKDALEHYEIKMRKRASGMAQESLENGDRMHATDALENMISFFQRHLS
ncbi:FAD-dependent oxidoreductase [Sphingobacterium tabacisoli]|uniref:Flavin-dependent monooxygenase n=1 Tax=Sphingobacterium tabacisoli TaxID=2044855 RepID=A0ABW5L2B6_9SPHI|nr:NAD(P)/FAD-dependent oxidoreductase [Sphingobacterium tabacisoli]